jgi:hypothetical protein
MLLVQGKALGRKKPLFDEFSVSPPATGDLTLRSLLGHVVRQEVAAFKNRQAERRLLHALTAKQIEEGLAQGKVDSGGSMVDQKVDIDAAIATAIEAFQDGLYLVVLDETELKDLDAAVSLTAASRLTFIRLSLLAGG